MHKGDIARLLHFIRVDTLEKCNILIHTLKTLSKKAPDPWQVSRSSSLCNIIFPDISATIILTCHFGGRCDRKHGLHREGIVKTLGQIGPCRRDKVTRLCIGIFEHPTIVEEGVEVLGTQVEQGGRVAGHALVNGVRLDSAHAERPPPFAD